MDFKHEPSVKIYPAKTPTSRLWGFWGSVLMEQLVKNANRAGVIELPDELGNADVATAVASVIECGHDNVEWVRTYLPLLLDHGAVREVEGHSKKRYLVLTRYHEGQYSGVDAKLSKRLHQTKIRETEEAAKEGLFSEKPFWWSKDREWPGLLGDDQDVDETEEKVA